MRKPRPPLLPGQRKESHKESTRPPTMEVQLTKSKPRSNIVPLRRSMPLSLTPGTPALHSALVASGMDTSSVCVQTHAASGQPRDLQGLRLGDSWASTRWGHAKPDRSPSEVGDLPGLQSYRTALRRWDDRGGCQGGTSSHTEPERLEV